MVHGLITIALLRNFNEDIRKRAKIAQLPWPCWAIYACKCTSLPSGHSERGAAAHPLSSSSLLVAFILHQSPANAAFHIYGGFFVDFANMFSTDCLNLIPPLCSRIQPDSRYIDWYPQCIAQCKSFQRCRSVEVDFQHFRNFQTSHSRFKIPLVCLPSCGIHVWPFIFNSRHRVVPQFHNNHMCCAWHWFSFYYFGH